MAKKQIEAEPELELIDVRYKLTGIAPLIMHNGQLANPLNPLVKRIRTYTSKKKKVDSDYEEIARLEWTGSLYVDEEDDLCIPADNFDKMLVRAAMKSKQGNDVKIAAFAMEDSKLLVSGKKINAPESLFADSNFVKVAIKCVQKARVVRTRPIFRDWSCTVLFQLDKSAMNLENLDQLMNVAGRRIGLCEERPRMGRFLAERVK